MLIKNFMMITVALSVVFAFEAKAQVTLDEGFEKQFEGLTEPTPSYNPEGLEVDNDDYFYEGAGGPQVNGNNPFYRDGYHETKTPPVTDPNIVTECKKVDKPIKWSYCITRTPDNQGDDLLYFFHGLGGAAEDWSRRQETKTMRDTWRKIGYKAPTVVSISFGKVWLLAEKNRSRFSGLFELVVSYIMPAIEAELGGLHGRRLVAGMSMGGFNTSQLVLKVPHLFKKAALACPAMGDVSPFAPIKEIKKWTQLRKASPLKVTLAVALVRAFFPSEGIWNTANPIVVGQTSLGSRTPSLHVSCGDKDRFGFYNGAELFAETAEKKGVKAMWQSLKGGHCTMDPESIATFLSEP